MKFLYTMAALAVAGAMSLSASAQETNLMEGAISNYEAQATPTAPWLAYNTNSNEFGNGNGWQFRGEAGSMSDSGPAAQLFLRWNDGNSAWVYAYEIDLDGFHNYSFTCDATTNDGKPNSLLIGVTTDMATAKSLTCESYDLNGHDSGVLWTDPLKVEYNFETAEAGKYYLVFKSTNLGGNIIIRIANVSLVDKGAKTYTKEDFEALVAQAEELANTAVFDGEGIYAGEEQDALFNAMSYYGDDYDTAYKTLKAAMAAFEVALPKFLNFYQMQAYIMPYAYEDFEGAGGAAIRKWMQACMTWPENGDEAQAAAEAFLPALRGVFESQALNEAEEAENVTDKIVNPADASTNDGWTIAALEGYSKTAGIRQNQGEGGVNAAGETMSPYWDSNNWDDSNWGFVFSQNLEALEPGEYRLSLYARGSEGLAEYKLFAGENETDLIHIGGGTENPYNNVFSHGWNIAFVDFTVPTVGDVEIGVKAGNSGANHNWLSFYKFQLVRVAEVPVVAPEVPEILANDEAPEGDVINAMDEVTITFEAPEGVRVYYKWTPKEEAPVTADVDYDSFTLYTEPLLLTKDGVLEFYAENAEGMKSEVKAYTVTIETSGVEAIEAAGAEAEYFNMNGVKVAAENLVNGVYVVRKGNKTYKVIVK